MTITIPPAHVISELTMPTGVRSLPSKQILSATPLLLQHSSGRDSEFLDMRLRNILCEMYNAEMRREGRKVERLTGIVRTLCDAIGSVSLTVIQELHALNEPSPSPSPVPPSPIPSEHGPNTTTHTVTTPQSPCSTSPNTHCIHPRPPLHLPNSQRSGDTGDSRL